MVVETRRRSRAKSIGSDAEEQHPAETAPATPTRRSTRSTTPSRRKAEAEEETTPARQRRTRGTPPRSSSKKNSSKKAKAPDDETMEEEEPLVDVATAVAPTNSTGKPSATKKDTKQADVTPMDDTTPPTRRGRRTKSFGTTASAPQIDTTIAKEQEEGADAEGNTETKVETTKRRTRSLSSTSEGESKGGERQKGRRTRSMGAADEKIPPSDSTARTRRRKNEDEPAETAEKSNASRATKTGSTKKSATKNKTPAKEAQPALSQNEHTETTSFRGTSLSPKSRENLKKMEQDDVEITSGRTKKSKNAPVTKNDDTEEAQEGEQVDEKFLNSIPTMEDMEVFGQPDNSAVHEEDASEGATGGESKRGGPAGTKGGNKEDASVGAKETIQNDQSHEEADSNKEMDLQKSTAMELGDACEGEQNDVDDTNNVVKDTAAEKNTNEAELGGENHATTTKNKDTSVDEEARSSDVSGLNDLKLDNATENGKSKEQEEDEDGEDKSSDEEENDKSAFAAKTEDSKRDPTTRANSFKKSRRRNRRAGKNEPRNELTHILPGYTAPMRLMTAWSQSEPSSGGSGLSGDALEDMRRKALREDAAHLKQSANARIMAQRSTTGNLTASYQESHAKFHKKPRKRLASADTAGAGWFNMRATPMTEEVERDMALIRNRNYLDPKRFYKSADKPRGGKAFVQAGTVIEGPTEFYSSRLSKKQRRSNLVDEVMADPESTQWTQQKYKKMQQEKSDSAQKWRKTVSNPQDYRKKKAR